MCSKGHEWLAPPNHVALKGTGCPKCIDAIESKREKKCRLVVEGLTGVPFPKSKPNWLVSSKGYQMELDGYSESLSVAFEHQGIQHYKYVPFFHSNRSLSRTQELDREKRIACSVNGVRLLEVRWDCNNISKFFRTELSKLGVLR